jgi:hypothetical protein
MMDGLLDVVWWCLVAGFVAGFVVLAVAVVWREVER